jgi:hypothetical protein
MSSVSGRDDMSLQLRLLSTGLGDQHLAEVNAFASSTSDIISLIQSFFSPSLEFLGSHSRSTHFSPSACDMSGASRVAP